MNKNLQTPLFLALAILAGIFFTWGRHLTFLVRYSVMIMLFFAFLKTEFQKKSLSPKNFSFLFINIFSPFLWFFLLRDFSPELGQFAFLIAVMPSGAAATVLSGFLNQKVEIVTVAVLISNSLIALILPFALPIVMPEVENISTSNLLIPIFTTVFLPLFLAQSIRYYVPRLKDRLVRYDRISFFLFVANVYIAISKASFFIQFETNRSWDELLKMFLLAAIVCAVNFIGGHFIGAKDLRAESSMVTGRKNTMFGIWVGLTYMTPLVAIGPMIYIICQNTYQSYLLGREKR